MTWCRQKQESVEPPNIVFPDGDAISENSRQLTLCCDASVEGIGATLGQNLADDPIPLIVFISRATFDSKRNWTPFDLEAGAIEWVIKRLRVCLRGTTFYVFLDQKTLKNLAKISQHNPQSANTTRAFSVDWSFSSRHLHPPPPKRCLQRQR